MLDGILAGRTSQHKTGQANRRGAAAAADGGGTLPIILLAKPALRG